MASEELWILDDMEFVAVVWFGTVSLVLRELVSCFGGEMLLLDPCCLGVEAFQMLGGRKFEQLIGRFRVRGRPWSFCIAYSSIFFLKIDVRFSPYSGHDSMVETDMLDPSPFQM
jgi:hypothetical protein